jgi:malignant T-cell-amplified sequence
LRHCSSVAANPATPEIIANSRCSITPGTRTKLKSSAQRALRTQILTLYPALTPYIDTLIPKKDQLDSIKLPDRITLYALGPNPLFFTAHTTEGNEVLLPHLKIVHQYPECWKRVRVDRGAIRFVCSGANLMAPGFTSKGGRLPGEEDSDIYGTEELERGTPVVVEAEGKENACFVGVLKMGTAEVKKEKKGQAVEGGHYLGDGLWRLSLD